MSLNLKPTLSRVVRDAPLLPVAAGTTLVLITYVLPIATIPVTAADLGAGTAARAWILSSMSLGLAASLLASGVLGDTFGRRRLYLSGLVALAVGALVCAVSTSPAVFVGARVLQGLGGAAVLACGLAILAHRHPVPAERVRATSVWGASVGLGIVLGGVLSAVLDIGSGWRETYAVTAALALLLLWPSRRSMAESRAESPRAVDVPGLVLLVAAMTLAVAALTQARNGLDAATLVLAALALVTLVAFVVAESRVTAPLVEPALLHHPRFRAAVGGSFVLGTGMIGMASFAPTLVQLGFGRGLWASTLPILGWAGTGVIASLLVRRIPHPLEGPRPVAFFLVVVAVGQVLTRGVRADDSIWRLVLPLVVCGLGTGVLNAVLGRESIASVPPDRAAMGSGAQNTARYLGAAVGITLFVTVATHTGEDLFEGFGNAALVAGAISLLGAALIALSGRGTA